ncbi:DUF262 domain-containing protein [uncultured Oscillibacter sp.]|uniref:HNH endonuclease family protein n=1 Tax=uncultured Oscillibacter sp. TaxID=876091 RepID=UPI0025F516ED|nr:DUF262 domain-containing protein [uncultured Oscillibacter sp.]
MLMTIEELYEQVRDGKIISDISLQREIVYNTEKQQLVIDSIVHGIPLPAFYFWENEDGILEVLDGKQRIHAITRFKENDIEYEGKIWRQTDPAVQEVINRCELSLIVCSGNEELKREIFKRINTLGVPLSKYEVLNGLYNGEYLRGLSSYVENDRDAKKVLGANSRGNNQYKVLGLLKTLKHFESIDEYVKGQQDTSFDTDQREISRYIRFISEVFDKYDNLAIRFGLAVKYIRDITIWKEHKREINSHVARFLKSDDAKIIKDKAGEIEDIILAVVRGISVDPKRLFSSDDKLELLRQSEEADGKYQCAICHQWFTADELTVDHVTPWSLGGRTVLSNAQLLCVPCNSHKGNRT